MFGAAAAYAHFIFESLAYVTGFALYRHYRQRFGDFLPSTDRSSVIVAAIVGAAIGSKLLGWLEDPMQTLQHWRDPLYLLGGKTIVGGLLGGTMAVEWTKAMLGIQRRTGDLFAVPICVAIAFGRFGCFFAGLSDHTYGIATSLPWGIDFGDGIRRHPTQLYEVAFCGALALFLHRLAARPHREGDLYRVFLFSYSAWRFAIDFLKPEPRLAGLTAIQWCSAAAVVWYGRDIAAIGALRRTEAAHG
jgi:phosphatidylglycerol:prolipoprotein diacylglycerol transferase